MAITPLPPEEKQALYDAIVRAIYEGALKVEYGDKKVEYRSLNEMVRIKQMLEAELGGGSPRRTYASFSKGTYPTNCE
jgi:hypothetical protein